MSVTVRIPVWSAALAPLPGLSPSWYGGVVKVAATGADATAPSIADLGNGEYLVLLNASQCGVVDFGGTVSPRYRLVEPGDGTIVLLAQDATTGEPKTGVIPGWASWVDDDGDPVSPQPTYAALGLGLYRVDPAAGDDNGHGFADLSSACDPRYPCVTQPPGGGPVVADDPASGSTIGGTDAIQHDVTDTDASLTNVVLVAYWTNISNGARYSAPAPELVHDGTAFAPGYSASSRSAIVGGFRYLIRRRGGWPGGKCTNLETFASDDAGNAIP